MSKPSSLRDEGYGANIGWSATSTMLGGLALWGGIGWLLDQWWGTKWATPVGVILGLALGVYAVVMRYGRADLAEHQATGSQQAATKQTSLER